MSASVSSSASASEDESESEIERALAVAVVVVVNSLTEWYSSYTSCVVWCGMVWYGVYTCVMNQCLLSVPPGVPG